jgi:uncharacterized protein YjbI with pentapeptide repeats
MGPDRQHVNRTGFAKVLPAIFSKGLPAIVVVALSAITIIAIQTLLIEPLKRSDDLSRDIEVLKGLVADTEAQQRKTDAELGQLIKDIKRNGHLDKSEELRKAIEDLKQALTISTNDASNKVRDSLGLINAQREQVKLSTGIHTGFLQALGSTFVIATVFIAIRNLGLAQKNLEVSENKLTSELIAKATDHLGNKDSIVRLGGVNTLTWSAKTLFVKKEYDSAFTIVNTLMGFIVERSNRLRHSTATTSALPIDIFAALRFLLSIGEDLRAGLGLASIDLRHSNFSRMQLNGLHLVNVDLRSAKINQSELKDSRLTNSQFDLANAKAVDFTNTSMGECTFGLCALEHAMVKDASIQNSSFKSADFGIGFNFSQVKCLESSDFTLALMPKVVFDGITMKDVQFNGADLSSSSFKNCTITGVSFDNASLKDADLKDTVIVKCSYFGCDFSGVNLQGLKFENENLRGARNITAKQLLQADSISAIAVDEWLEREIIEHCTWLLSISNSRLLLSLFISKKVSYLY